MIFYNGATGGLGRHLGQELARVSGQIHVLRSRMQDGDSVQGELDSGMIDLSPGSRVVLIQLAAMVSVEDCERDPDRARMINVEAVRSTADKFSRTVQRNGGIPSVLYVSTGHVYAPPRPGHRVTERDPVGPRSVYATTKLEAERTIRDLAEHHAASVLVARVFGLVGPQQAPNYVLPSLILRAREGRLSDIPGLNNSRDYLDVRDICRHLASLGQQLIAGDPVDDVVNVCSGEATTIAQVLDLVLLAIHGASSDAYARAKAQVTGKRGRSTDLPWLVGDPSRLIALTGEPARTIPLESTVDNALAS